jgi:hypothetical protein
VNLNTVVEAFGKYLTKLWPIQAKKIYLADEPKKTVGQMARCLLLGP